MSHKYKKEILLEDERGREFAAVVKYGPYLFVSGSEGHRDLDTEEINPGLAWKEVEQCKNSYERVSRRLEKCGYSGDCAVRIQNYTSGQEWRLKRMALWPEYFGEFSQAVSWGSQAKMSGINMITSSVMALVPEIKRNVVVPQPERGRASRVTDAGDFVYVIGVRGTGKNPITGEAPLEEVPEAFASQQQICLDIIKTHLSKAGLGMEHIVSLDASIRNINLSEDYHKFNQNYFGGTIPFASTVIGMPLGGRGEIEIGAIAVKDLKDKEIRWTDESKNAARCIKAGNLAFISGCVGNRDIKNEMKKERLCNDKISQYHQVLKQLEFILNQNDSDLDHVLRMDVFLRDIYCEDEFLSIAKEYFNGMPPAISIIGGEPSGDAEIEITTIAGC